MCSFQKLGDKLSDTKSVEHNWAVTEYNPSILLTFNLAVNSYKLLLVDSSHQLSFGCSGWALITESIYAANQ